MLFAVARDVGSRTKLFAGYRVLEGGSDSDQVYSFSLFHSVVAGVETRFEPGSRRYRGRLPWDLIA